MVFEIWRSDESGTIIQAGDGRTRAMEMHEPNTRLVRRVEALSWDALRPRFHEELSASRPDDLNIPASEFQIREYSNGIRVGDLFEIIEEYHLQLPEGGFIPSFPVGTRLRVVEGDIQAPDLVVLRRLDDDVGQFHIIGIESDEWRHIKKG